MHPAFGNHTALLHDQRRHCWWLFEQPLAIHAAYATSDVLPMLATVERRVQETGCWAVGFIAYEAAPAFDNALTVRAPTPVLPLLYFGLYPAPREFPASAFTIPVTPAPLHWQPSLGATDYRQAIARIKDYIGAGDTYQVNYTFRLHSDFHTDPWLLFVQMIRAQGAAYGAFFNTDNWTLCSASPELFLQLDGCELRSRPMKGTLRSGLWHEDDCNRPHQLRHSQKERAENVMIVDMVRNDLGRIADLGSVQVPDLFTVERYPTIWQLTSTVSCTTDASLTDILRALFPPASITGTPKRRAMQIIAELETTPRGIYTGTLGFIAPQRQAQFNVAIRTVAVDKQRQQAEYGVGSGIIWDSETAAEYQECCDKALILKRPQPEFALLETLLWTADGYFLLLEEHLTRLRHSAAFFNYPLDPAAIRRQLHAFAATLPAKPYRIRLTVPRDAAISLTAQPLDQQPPIRRVCLAPTPIASDNLFLYHKTTHRQLYEHAKRACPDYDDVLLWNERGELTESCLANLIVEIAGDWYTPPIHCGLLPGVYRHWLLAQGKLKERIIHCDELASASRLFLINSVRGQWPLRQWPGQAAGAVTPADGA